MTSGPSEKANVVVVVGAVVVVDVEVVVFAGLLVVVVAGELSSGCRR